MKNIPVSNKVTKSPNRKKVYETISHKITGQTIVTTLNDDDLENQMND
jgi:hypothetical protein